MPKKYRKKPVIVEALRVNFGYTNIHDIKDFIGESFNDVYRNKAPYIETLEGNMYISDGDYIIKGVKGEFYPCKPDIFEATYEAVDNDDNIYHALFMRYGFTHKQAEVLLADPKSRAIILSNLEEHIRNETAMKKRSTHNKIS